MTSNMENAIDILILPVIVSGITNNAGRTNQDNRDTVMMTYLILMVSTVKCESASMN